VSFFARIEQLCAGLIERAFAKTFPSDLEPAQIARKLVSTMEAKTRDEAGALRAPAAYAVYMSASDFERLAEHQKYLERAWAELVRELAAKVGVALEGGDARVSMAARARLPKGAIEIEATAPVASIGYRLRTLEGVPPGEVYPLKRRSRIGRSDEGEIVLLDPSVSRAHAIVEVLTEGAIVRDLGSTNGTFVNGRRVQSRRLRDGDELRFGNTRLRFEAI
jgi:hypothetical protein